MDDLVCIEELKREIIVQMNLLEYLLYCIEQLLCGGFEYAIAA